MKNRIYFFTGTGNSFRIAEEIGEELQNFNTIVINVWHVSSIAHRRQ